MKVGILGAGHIAEKMAATLGQMPHKAIAVASRDLQKAQTFAARFGIPRAYGSYLELVSDPEIDLIYVATPHSHHFDHIKLAVEHGKAVLCEKSFTMNAAQAEEILSLAESKGVFVTEAIWTRYMPFSQTIRDLAFSGAIGEPKLLSATLSYPVLHKERVQKPELGGGALLDIGVYTINFARMIFGGDYASVKTQAVLGPTGVDIQESISIIYKDGRMANLQAGAICANDRQGVINGDKGYIVVDNINDPLEAKLYSKDHELVETYHAPEQITGFEYQVEACADALSRGLLESPYMPHRETIDVLRTMDSLRAEWGVKFPCD